MDGCDYLYARFEIYSEGRRGECMQIENMKWICYPICGGKTHDRIKEDTILRNYPLYCPKCRQESLIDAKDLHVKVIKGIGVKKQC